MNLDKYTKIVLKYLNNHSNKDNPICINNICENVDLDITLIEQSLKNLENDLYIESTKTFKKDNKSFKGYIVYWSTIKGKEYFKEQLKQNIKYYLDICLNSILCPIIVSIITSIITSLIVVLF